MKKTNMKRRIGRAALSVILALCLLCPSALAIEDRMIGRILEDDVFEAEGEISLTLSEGVDIETTGTYGGIGVDVRSHNDPVTAVIEGNPVRVTDKSETGFEAMGVHAVTQSGGSISLVLDTDVSVTAESQTGDAAAYGVSVGVESVISADYYLADNGARIPLTETSYLAAHFSAKEDGADVSEEFTDLYAYFREKADGWKLFVVDEEGAAYYWADGLTEDDVMFFCGYISGPGETTIGPITVTLHTMEGDSQRIVTIASLGGMGHSAYVDAGGRPFFGAVEDIVDPETGERHEAFSFENGQVDADISGSIYASATDAIGMELWSGGGTVDTVIRPGTQIEAEGTTAAGIYAWGTVSQTITGEDVTIRATGAEGEVSEAIGLWLLPTITNLMGKETVTLTGENHIYAKTMGTPKTYSAGILLTSSIRSNVDLYYEGSIDAEGSGMIGIQIISMQGSKGNATVIGDVNLKDSDRDGLYARTASGIAMLGMIPKADLYMRGNVSLTQARGDAAGIDALGATVIVDGDITVEGEGEDLTGIYADESATVLVTGKITAPIAVWIPGDDGSVTNNSYVYVMEYSDTSIGKTENIGFTLLVDEGVEAALSGESDMFYTAEKDGRSYYGTSAGDTVTVTSSQDKLIVLDAHGNAVETTAVEGGFTFVVPEDCGVRITVEEEPPAQLRGDFDGDGMLTTDDAIYLLRHVLLPDLYPISQSGNVNGDGRVTTDDAIYLLRHVLDPARYPIKNGGGTIVLPPVPVT